MDFSGNFWDILLWTLWIFVFVMYLFVLFRVVIDIFRNDETNGFVKAIWIIALIFVPFLTLIIYLIANGQGMAKREMKQAVEMKQAQDDYIKNVAGSSATDQIAQAKQLLDSGAISQAEFDQIKSKALAG
jgi:type VI protein secretion system component VasK